jgi:hypothetical protein
MKIPRYCLSRLQLLILGRLRVLVLILVRLRVLRIVLVLAGIGVLRGIERAGVLVARIARVRVRNIPLSWTLALLLTLRRTPSLSLTLILLRIDIQRQDPIQQSFRPSRKLVRVIGLGIRRSGEEMHQVGERLRFLVGCEGGKRRMESGVCSGHGGQILRVIVLPMTDKALAIAYTDIHASQGCRSRCLQLRHLARRSRANNSIFATSFSMRGCYQESDLLPCFREPASGNPPICIRRSLGN